MEIIPTNFAVADYCQMIERNEIQVNRNWQRSDKVWPTAARAFLIETVLLNFPVPKISLSQRLDVKSRKTIKEIVDGQQRSMALFEFYKGKLRLSKRTQNPDLDGRSYSELPEEYQERFLNYSISADIFVGTDEATIREVFRRINSYTVPLNPEEIRHATFQGEFKWFIYRLSKSNDTALKELGVFGEKGFVRMQDAKLLTEVAHALIHGITTTDKKALDKMYETNDPEFPLRESLETRITDAIKVIHGWEDLYGSPLVKPFMIYSLLLAVIHISNPVDALQKDFQLDARAEIDESEALPALTELVEALQIVDQLEDVGQYKGAHKDFILASKSKTNVASQRQTRFREFCESLIGIRI